MKITDAPLHDCQVPSAPEGAVAKWRCPECRQRWRLNGREAHASRQTNWLSSRGDGYRYRRHARRRLQAQMCAEFGCEKPIALHGPASGGDIE